MLLPAPKIVLCLVSPQSMQIQIQMVRDAYICDAVTKQLLKESSLERAGIEESFHLVVLSVFVKGPGRTATAVERCEMEITWIVKQHLSCSVYSHVPREINAPSMYTGTYNFRAIDTHCSSAMLKFIEEGIFCHILFALVQPFLLTMPVIIFWHG